MIYYLLPNVHPHTYTHLQVSKSPQPPAEFLSHTLSKHLTEIKNKLTPREKEWDIYKKYTNNYEYIHTMVPYKKKCVAKYKPLSRSYFKMVELIHSLDIFDIKQNSSHPKYFTKKPNAAVSPDNTAFTPIQTFHLAEGPGGFIEAVANIRNNTQDVYYGMTLVDDKNDGTIPSWKKSNHFLATHPNIVIEYGADNTGNIMSVENFRYCVLQYGSSMDFITADGGFDFSLEFNKQELNMTQLLFAQICYALCLQKKGGSFVLKIFDVFYEHTLDMIYLLASMYQKVYFTKPLTSRLGNSEKYLVCKDFIFDNASTFHQNIEDAFVSAMECGENEYICRLLNIPKTSLFKSKIEEYNIVFGQQQIENIHFTISLIDVHSKTDKINQLIKNNISKCINWCMKYNIPYNNISNNNIFLFNYSGENGEEHGNGVKDDYEDGVAVSPFTSAKPNRFLSANSLL